LAENAAAGPGHRASLVPWLAAKAHPRKPWFVVGGIVLIVLLVLAFAHRATRDNPPRTPAEFWGS
jgi:hypothetical protein